ncbi:MAG: hypothetical protein PHS61_05505 [Candidatus Omnitrophica bacterium]|nr:hypothetical protein [Candidatus Omnitrophota bacterium]
MNNRVKTGVIALLAGFSVFGVYQSLTLWRQNEDLTGQLNRLQIDLSAAQLSLNQTRTLLSGSYQKNAQLENDVVLLKTRLDRAKKELDEQKQKIGSLIQHLHESREVNEFLRARNTDVSDQYIRLAFENQEMKKTLSSIAELKKAIAALRKKPVRRVPAKKAVRKSQAAPQPRPRVAAVPPPAVDRDLEGNEGFVVKDGESTLLDLVDIQVVPAPEKSQPSKTGPVVQAQEGGQKEKE